MAITEAAKVIIIIVEGDNDAELLQQYVDELTRHSRTQYHFEITMGISLVTKTDVPRHRILFKSRLSR
ncbi:hypothetical protein SN13T_1693 [Lactiplantibacillus plantarum]|nr:hypothetical protein SN13T_1693 [Lactiplantibacillus plantarum]